MENVRVKEMGEDKLDKLMEKVDKVKDDVKAMHKDVGVDMSLVIVFVGGLEIVIMCLFIMHLSGQI